MQWANLHLLFLLSLLPFATARVGTSNFAVWPVAIYGLDLLLAAVACFLLGQSLISLHGSESVIAAAPGHDVKGKISAVI